VNRFNRWRKAGVWDRLLVAVSAAYEGDIQMIDSSSNSDRPWWVCERETLASATVVVAMKDAPLGIYRVGSGSKEVTP